MAKLPKLTLMPSNAPAQLVEPVLPFPEESGIASAIGMMALALSPRLQDLLVIGLDEHVAQRPDLGVAQNPNGRLDAVEWHVTQRSADVEAPVMISGRSPQGFRSRSVNRRTLRRSKSDCNDAGLICGRRTFTGPPAAVNYSC
jgi:hypothetical protein